MLALIAGLVLFLGIHSVRMVAPDFRADLIQKLGKGPWKGIFSLIALAGFVLVVWGYGQARQEPIWIWGPPVWTRHLAALLMLPAFIFLVAAYIPGTLTKARLGHPMVLAVKTWALAHLLSNGTVADLLLFGGFLAWSVVYFIWARRRDRANGKTYPAVGVSRDLVAIVAGVVLWVGFALVAHEWLIGVRPF